MQVSHKHHFVPKLLLSAWLKPDDKNQVVLHGYYWNEMRGELACKRKGMDGFCRQIDLLTLSAHHLGRDAIERIFFGQIDHKGSIARNALIDRGPQSLSQEQRLDYARFVVSLEARRPKSVEMLREAGQFFTNFFDESPEVVTAFEHEGISDQPSAHYERMHGSTIEDRILTLVQTITDSPRAYLPLVNAHWHLLRLGPRDGSFILADRPLIRDGSIKNPDGIWILPLTPKVAFMASAQQNTLSRIESASKFQVCRHINIQSALQAQCYVFSTDSQDTRWLGKYLGPREGS